MFTSWNERDMPRRASSTGPTPAISLPRNRTSPILGASSPVTTLTSVVLPAPFGPTIETNSPSLTRNETLLSALNAPKTLVTLMVSNKGPSAWSGCILPTSPAPVCQGFDSARKTLRHEEHEKNEHAAHHKTPVLRDRHDEILQQHESKRPDCWPSKSPAAS